MSLGVNDSAKNSGAQDCSPLYVGDGWREWEHLRVLDYELSRVDRHLGETTLVSCTSAESIFYTTASLSGRSVLRWCALAALGQFEPRD